MNPQQPYYQPPPQPAPPQNTGQYDFITDGGYQQPTRFGGGGSKKSLLIIVVGALVLIGLLWLIFSLVFGGTNNQLTPLVGIAQQQTEMLRITTAATNGDSLTTQDTKNFAHNAELSLTTDQKTTVDFMAKNGKKVDAKQLGLKQSKQTDDALAAASASGTYESTYVSIMQQQLKAYQASLKQTYNAATSPVEKQLLATEYDNAGLLVQQSTQHS